MGDISETIKNVPTETTGFFKYITTFEDEHKCELMNVIQYSILAIIPVILILRIVKVIIPDEDESKGSLELSMESVLQIIFIICMIWLTNRIIVYIPTYSKCSYGSLTSIHYILPFLIILFTLQSKLGFKLNILTDRVIDAWHGKSSEQQQPAQPPQQSNPNFILQPQTHQPSQADYLDTNNLLPSNPQHSSMPSQQQVAPQQVAMQQAPDFNAMHSGPQTPLVDAGPIAANEGMGGFSSW